MNVRIQIIIGVIVLGALVVIVNMIRQKNRTKICACMAGSWSGHIDYGLFPTIDNLDCRYDGSGKSGQSVVFRGLLLFARNYICIDNSGIEGFHPNQTIGTGTCAV